MDTLKYAGFLLLIFSFLFSGITLGENDEEDIPESEKEKIDLLQVRELGVRSFSISSSAVTDIRKEEVSQSNVSAWYDGEKISIEVDNFYGKVYISVEGICNEVFIVTGSGVFDIQLDDILGGSYSIEIKTGSNRYIGVLDLD